MFLCNFYPVTDTEAVAELRHILSRKWSHKFLQKLWKLRKEESQKGEERNGWMDSLRCVYLWWLRIKSLRNHIRNYKEYASVLSHQWKRRKKNRIQDCLSVTLGFWEILEVPGGLVVLEKTPRQSRKKNQHLSGENCLYSQHQFRNIWRWTQWTERLMVWV